MRFDFCHAAGTGLLATALLLGCSEQSDRINAPPQGLSGRQNPLMANFTYMNDNAMLLDSCVTDLHFEPHTADLSGTGLRRLTRMGELLNECGGEIHYETSIANEDLVNNRLEAVREFLVAEGYEPDRISVRGGLARSGAMSASEAIEIKNRGFTDNSSTNVPGVSTAPGGDPP